jgi:hypothetical protein
MRAMKRNPFRRFSWSTVTLGVLLAAATTIAAARNQNEPYPAPPDPIGGTWKCTCPSFAGMTVELTVAKNTASGKIVVLGNAGNYGFKPGEVIFQLEANDFGAWVGKARWRSLSGAERWDPIRIHATANELRATQTTEDCYRSMPRVK